MNPNEGSDSMMANDLEKKRAILKFCEGLFATSNLIGTDFDDVNVTQVKGRDFVQQPGGDGLHVTFSVSWHAIGKAHGISREVIAVLRPEDGEDGTAQSRESQGSRGGSHGHNPG